MTFKNGYFFCNYHNPHSQVFRNSDVYDLNNKIIILNNYSFTIFYLQIQTFKKFKSRCSPTFRCYPNRWISFLVQSRIRIYLQFIGILSSTLLLMSAGILSLIAFMIDFRKILQLKFGTFF